MTTEHSRRSGPDSLQGRVGGRATDKSVRDLPVRAKLKLGQVIVEQAINGVVFSFPAAVWPDEHVMQWSWIVRLTPWWDVPRQDWTPQAHRLREACQKAINQLFEHRVPETAKVRQRTGSAATSSAQERPMLANVESLNAEMSSGAEPSAPSIG